MAEAVELKYRYFGGEGNPPLVILHGLLGHSRNWQTAAQALAQHFEVFALDLRNHGDSPHVAPHDYPSMVADVLAWMQAHDLDKAWLLGHSMGGKAAMRLACLHPERVEALIVSDIAPVLNPPYNAIAFAAMAATDTAGLQRREDADVVFQRYGLRDETFRKFLLAALVRVPDGGFRWRHNMDALMAGLKGLGETSLAADMRYLGPTLFMRGEQSPFIQDEHAPIIEKHFPHYILSTIPNAGHNIHSENLQGMLSVMGLFRDRVQGA